MAEVQNGAQMWQFIAQHPIYATLASIMSVGGSISAVLLHPSSPVSYGRLLTEADAHGPPPEDESPLCLQPAVPQLQLEPTFEIPHNLSLSAEMPVPIRPYDPQTTPAPCHPFASVADNAHTTSVQQILSLTGVLIMAVGSAAALALVMKLFQKNETKAISDAHIIAFLQSSIIEANKKIENLDSELHVAQQEAWTAHVAEQASSVARETAENMLHTCQTDLKDCQAAEENCQNELRTCQTDLKDCQAAEENCQNELKVLQAKLNRTTEDLRATENELFKTDQWLNDAHHTKDLVCKDLRIQATELEHALREQISTSKKEKDADSATLAVLEAEGKKLKILHEQEMAAEEATMRQEMLHLQNKMEAMQKRCLFLQQQVDFFQEQSDCYLQGVSDLKAVITSIREKHEKTLSVKDASIADLKTELQSSQDDLASITDEHLLEKMQLHSRIEVMEQEEKSHVMKLQDALKDTELQLHRVSNDFQIELAAKKKLEGEVGSLSQEKEHLATKLNSSEQIATEFSILRHNFALNNSELARLQQEKDDAIRQLQTMTASDQAKSVQLLALEDEKRAMSTNLADSQHGNTERDEALRVVMQSHEEKTADNADLRQRVDQLQSQLQASEHVVEAQDDELRSARESKDLLEVNLEVLRGQHMTEVETMKTDQIVVTEAAVKSAVDAAVESEQEKMQLAHEKHDAEVKHQLEQSTTSIKSLRKELEEANTLAALLKQGSVDQANTAMEHKDRENEQCLVLIKDLEEIVERNDAALANLQRKLQDLQQQYKSDMTEKDKDIQTQALEMEEQRLLFKSLADNQKQAPQLRTDRVIAPDGLKWSSASIKEDFKDVVRHGVLQQGLYRSEKLVRIQLPHSDPFYSDLPHPIPKPCDTTENGKIHSCEQCRETYAERDYYKHGRMCLFFFKEYAAFCAHCQGLFVSNDALKEHERVCGKAWKSGIAPEVLAQQPPISEFNILGKDAPQTPPSSSHQDIAQKKTAAMGTISSDTCIRAILPYADRDYAYCSLPEPVEQLRALPRGFTGLKFAQKIWCCHCKQWYRDVDFTEHVQMCVSFFKGSDGHFPHAYCHFCGDIFRDNNGFATHVELCKMYPSKARCSFCEELFDIEDGKLSEHKPTCYLNPNREYYPDTTPRNRRKQKMAESDLETLTLTTHPISDKTHSTVAEITTERAFSSPTESSNGRPLGDRQKNNAEAASQTRMSVDEPTSLTTTVTSHPPPTESVSSPATEFKPQTLITGPPSASSTTALIASSAMKARKSSPATTPAISSPGFSSVMIGVNRAPRPPLPLTPSPSTLDSHLFTPSSSFATPFVPRTASPTQSYSYPPSRNQELQDGLEISRYSPGFAGSHPGPPMTAYSNYTTPPPPPPPQNYHSLGYRGPHEYLPQFQNNLGMPTQAQIRPGLTPSLTQQVQNSPELPSHTQRNSGLSPSPSTSRSTRPINTTPGSANTFKRAFLCRVCQQHLPKAIFEAHIPACRAWRYGARDVPPPHGDQAFHQ